MFLKNAIANVQDARISRVLFVIAMVAVAAMTRLLPHPPNFTPMAAIALFGAATLSSRWATVAIVMGAMLVSDLFLGMHAMMPVVYLCLLFNVGMGMLLRGRMRALPIMGATLLGSVVFFLVTNFACWIQFYDRSVSGLIACYAAAIPFFQYTLAGDVLFSAVLFGSLALSQAKFPLLRTTAAA